MVVIGRSWHTSAVIWAGFRPGPLYLSHQLAQAMVLSRRSSLARVRRPLSGMGMFDNHRDLTLD